MELTRFRGHLTVVAGGVHDGRQDGPVYAGVQAADGGVSPVRADRGIAVEGVRSLRDDDRDVDQAAARDAGKGDGGLSSAEREELTRLRRENRRLKEEREILSKAAAWFATESGPSKRSLGFVKVNQAIHAVGLMCRLLEVSRSGFYAWVDRPMCTRRRWDLELTGNICSTHRRSRETYGAPNIHAELADDHGIRVGRKRVARLMRRNGI